MSIKINLLNEYRKLPDDLMHNSDYLREKILYPAYCKAKEKNVKLSISFDDIFKIPVVLVSELFKNLISINKIEPDEMIDNIEFLLEKKQGAQYHKLFIDVIIKNIQNHNDPSTEVENKDFLIQGNYTNDYLFYSIYVYQEHNQDQWDILNKSHSECEEIFCKTQYQNEIMENDNGYFIGRKKFKNLEAAVDAIYPNYEKLYKKYSIDFPKDFKEKTISSILKINQTLKIQQKRSLETQKNKKSLIKIKLDQNDHDGRS